MLRAAVWPRCRPPPSARRAGADRCGRRSSAQCRRRRNARPARLQKRVHEHAAVDLEPGSLGELDARAHADADDDEIGIETPPLFRRTRLSSMAVTSSWRWNTTPCSSCTERMRSPSCAPKTRSRGRRCGATTCTSRSRACAARPRLQADEARADHHGAPAGLARGNEISAVLNVRNTWTCGWSAPGTASRTGSAPLQATDGRRDARSSAQLHLAR